MDSWVLEMMRLFVVVMDVLEEGLYFGLGRLVMGEGVEQFLRLTQYVVHGETIEQSITLRIEELERMERHSRMACLEQSVYLANEGDLLGDIESAVD